MTKTVKVRIAVAVDPEGNWNSCGWSDAPSDKSMTDIAADMVGDGEAHFWLTAELPIPVVREVGEVEAKVEATVKTE
jgi:hypothetical protein